MVIENLKLDERDFKLITVNINGEEITCTDEKLNNYIVECIESDRYISQVREIDEAYSYVIPQEVFDTLDEEKIIESIVTSDDYFHSTQK